MLHLRVDSRGLGQRLDMGFETMKDLHSGLSKDSVRIEISALESAVGRSTRTKNL